MSNCVGLSGLGLPASAVAEHGVEGGNHLAHDGDDDDLGLLAGSGPWQPCGNGRNGWSTKLICGLVTEAATGFQP
jgi:hypothetical protein